MVLWITLIVMTVIKALSGPSSVQGGAVLGSDVLQANLETRKVVRWKLPLPELTLQDNRVHVVVKGKRKVKLVTFYMAINKRVTFKRPQYKSRLPCKKTSGSAGAAAGKVCEGTGGPQLTPDDTVFYNVRVKMGRRRVMTIKNQRWKPVFLTTTSSSTTQNPTTTPTCATISLTNSTTPTILPAGFPSPVMVSFGCSYTIEVPTLRRNTHL